MVCLLCTYSFRQLPAGDRPDPQGHFKQTDKEKNAVLSMQMCLKTRTLLLPSNHMAIIQPSYTQLKTTSPVAPTTFMLRSTALQEKKKKVLFRLLTYILQWRVQAKEAVERKLYLLGSKKTREAIREILTNGKSVPLNAQLWTVGSVTPGTGLKRILSMEEDGYLVTNLILRVTSRFPEAMVVGDAIYQGRDCWRGSGWREGLWIQFWRVDIERLAQHLGLLGSWVHRPAPLKEGLGWRSRLGSHQHICCSRDQSTQKEGIVGAEKRSLGRITKSTNVKE